ncbi:hypothetical protein WMY93_033988 [Mugilogobius chulae]|uniref:Uncharacterized protein n=1 Tax=Mugilogobius chulae TaxID=88201 RepID=A0AAW0MM20_9GOBI
MTQDRKQERKSRKRERRNEKEENEQITKTKENERKSIRQRLKSTRREQRTKRRETPTIRESIEAPDRGGGSAQMMIGHQEVWHALLPVDEFEMTGDKRDALFSFLLDVDHSAVQTRVSKKRQITEPESKLEPIAAPNLHLVAHKLLTITSWREFG